MSRPPAVANMDVTDEPDICVPRAAGQAVLADKPEFQPAVRRNAALRRMAEGILAELPPDDVVALGHALLASAKERHQALDAWAAHVLRHGEGDVPAGNVVRLAERVA